LRRPDRRRAGATDRAAHQDRVDRAHVQLARHRETRSRTSSRSRTRGVRS
jgi:hypothetical protein